MIPVTPENTRQEAGPVWNPLGRTGNSRAARGSPAAKAGLERGDVIGAINGTATGAAPMGLREGDVIVEVNRKPVASVEAFRDAARAAGDGAVLLVYRDGATIYLSLSR